MILYEPDKARARIHQGVPVLGIQDSGFALGYRFTNIIGLFEYRMNNLQPWEYAKITGYATASLSVMAPPGHPQVGDTIVATVGALPPFTYTVQSSDLLAQDPVYAACNNFCTAFNAVHGSVYIASPQPTVTWPISYNQQGPPIGVGPPQWQIAFVSHSTAAFTLGASSNSLVIAIVAQGQQVMPSVTFLEDNAICNGYLAICDYLQSKTATSSDLAKFSKAAEVTMRFDELGYREYIYTNWRQKLADYWGIALFPMKNSANRKTGLTI